MTPTDPSGAASNVRAATRSVIAFAVLSACAATGDPYQDNREAWASLCEAASEPMIAKRPSRDGLAIGPTCSGAGRGYAERHCRLGAPKEQVAVDALRATNAPYIEFLALDVTSQFPDGEIVTLRLKQDCETGQEDCLRLVERRASGRGFFDPVEDPNGFLTHVADSAAPDDPANPLYRTFLGLNWKAPYVLTVDRLVLNATDGLIGRGERYRVRDRTSQDVVYEADTYFGAPLLAEPSDGQALTTSSRCGVGLGGGVFSDGID